MTPGRYEGLVTKVTQHVGSSLARLPMSNDGKTINNKVQGSLTNYDASILLVVDFLEKTRII